MSLQSPPAATAAADLPPDPGEGLPPGAEVNQDSTAPLSSEEGGEGEEEGEEEKEREKLPPFPSASTAASGGLEGGTKNQFSTFSNFITTINQKKEGIGNRNSPTQLVIPNIKNVRDLPPICLDVRQKQRISIDTLPQEVKALIPPEPSLPIRTKTVKDFQDDVEKAKSSGDWKAVHDFYSATFDSFLEINAAFKKDTSSPFNTIEDSGINAKFVNVVYDALLNTPQDVQKSVLKGIINGLLQEWKGPRTKDDLRAYCILLQNPQFSNTSTYVIYAHLLRQIAALTEADHHFLVHWSKKISQRRFKGLVDRLLQFISLRLFPAKPEEFPPMVKCTWWIPSAAKVLALFNAANSLISPPVISYTDFYNSTLDHIDLMEEYHNWQCYGNSHRFSFCQYPFIISIAAKKVIIQRDSEQQMISIARQSLVDKVSRRQKPDMNMLFLNVKVRRTHLVSDSLDEFGSEVRFPDFCMKSTSVKTFSTSHLNSCFAVKKEQQLRNTDALPEVFHYYGPALEFLQMMVLSDLPSFFVSDLEFDLSLPRRNINEPSVLLLDQISSLPRKVGALFTLSCNVSSVVIPCPAQLSTKKWKEYMARKPKIITVPEIELKGESCRYYFLLQGNGSGGCKATLIYSASQINGTATLSALNGKLTTKAEETESGFRIADFIKSLPHFCGEEIVQREKKLSCLQMFALKEYLKRKELTKQPPVISTDEFKNLLELTRECFLNLCNTHLPKPVLQKVANKTRSYTVTSESALMEPNPLEWPERHVLQNLENFEKNKQKMRVSMFAQSSEQLLGHKDSQRESLTLLDAKELLKYFTPEGLPVGDLQPLQVPKRENTLFLTPELTPRKLRGLPFEKAAGCHYHGLEYCLDNRRALERDVGYAELQTRLIRYETQTTCTKECCPVPVVLSPLPSPAVLSEPGSVPDGESLQSEFKTEASRLKRRSRELDCFYPKKRLTKSGSTDSLLSQASGSSGSRPTVAVTRKRSERSVSLASVPLKQPGQPHKGTTRLGSASHLSATESDASKPAKESRSQKHTRMLKDVVAKTLQNHGITEDHKCFASCSQRLFEISKFYLKDLKTSRGLLDEMKKTAKNNAKQVIEWVLEKTGK